MRTSVAVLTAVLIIIVVWALYMTATTISDNRAHNEKCGKWSQHIEEERARLDQEWFADYDSFNADVNEFNRLCAF